MPNHNRKGTAMQRKTYVITAMIDGWEFALARDVPEEEVEGELQHLTRKHELKNVGRYEIKERQRESARASEAKRGLLTTEPFRARE